MTGLTWNEFKKLVDAAIAEAGATGDIEIQYIDISWPDKPVEGKSDYNVPMVYISNNGMLAVS